MSNGVSLPEYHRPMAALLSQRLEEPRRFIQVIAGPRQVGKSTLVQQVLSILSIPSRYRSADEPSLRGGLWIEEQWEGARIQLSKENEDAFVLVLDEIQKIPNWSETVKRLWDEDTTAGRDLRLVLLGSAPLLIGQGLNESLAGRFEIIRLPHWSFEEMNRAFGWDAETYIFYGGYPGSAPLIDNPERWARYIRDSLIETTISRDVLLLTRVDKPALLRQLFELACSYSGQILSFTKMLGQLHDAGNTTTLSHYLELLAGAGMVIGLQKYSGAVVRRRAASPKLQVMNTALMSALGQQSIQEAKADSTAWGRWIESCVGAHLVNAQRLGHCRVWYWRSGNREVDFVLESSGGQRIAIEVKSGSAPRTHQGLEAFGKAYSSTRKLVISEDGVTVADFLSRPVQDWFTS